MNHPTYHPTCQRIIRAFGTNLDKESSAFFWFVPEPKEVVLCGVLFSPWIELCLSVEDATEMILNRSEAFPVANYAPDKQWITFNRPIKFQCLKGVVTAGNPVGLTTVLANVYFLIQRI